VSALTSPSKALPWAKGCVWVGIVLSGLMFAPFLRLSDATPASWMTPIILFLFVALPFIVLAGSLRLGFSAQRVVVLSIPFLACHAILDKQYLLSDPHAQEFGYFGLFLVPVYESIIAVPVGVVIILIVQAFTRRGTRRA
jgi:membrane glycosyltransferase